MKFAQDCRPEAGGHVRSKWLRAFGCLSMPAASAARRASSSTPFPSCILPERFLRISFVFQLASSIRKISSRISNRRSDERQAENCNVRGGSGRYWCNPKFSPNEFCQGPIMRAPNGAIQIVSLLAGGLTSSGRCGRGQTSWGVFHKWPQHLGVVP